MDKITKPSRSSSDAEEIDETLATNFQMAASKGDLAELRKLIFSTNLTSRQKIKLANHCHKRHYNRTSLLLAARNGHVDVVQFLVTEMKADVTARDSQQLKSLAIHLACEKGHFDIVKYFVELHPKLLEMEDSSGATSLNLAAFAGHFPIVEYLVIERKANLENKGAYNRTPLLSAAEQGHTKIVEFLLENGADISAVSNSKSNGDAAIHLASGLGHVETVEALLKRKPDLIDMRNDLNDTPLNRAALAGQQKVVEYLLDKTRVDIDVRGDFHRTPLLQAADEGHFKVVEFLVSRGADVTASDSQNGDTCLHLAAYFDHVKIVNLLLDLGKGLEHVKNNQNLTPFVLAQRQQSNESLVVFKAKTIFK